MSNIIKKIEESVKHFNIPVDELIRASTKTKYNSKSEEELIEIVRKDHHSIAYITNPSKELQLEAVKVSCNVLIYLKNPCIEAQLKAVEFSSNGSGNFGYAI